MVRTGIYIYRVVSSSVANFEEKIDRKFGYSKWTFAALFKPTVFFGMYHPLDYAKFILHRGEKTVFWCGADILNLAKSPWQQVLRYVPARHVCENEIERAKLLELGIYASIKPQFFDDFPKEISFKATRKPHVYLTMHEGREKEYGLDWILSAAQELPEITFHVYGILGEDTKNVRYHGRVENRQFNEEIKEYQASIRLNRFDGFSEITAKSILLGQYPITRIHYGGITCVPSLRGLVNALRMLKTRRKPNPLREVWYQILCQKNLV